MEMAAKTKRGRPKKEPLYGVGRFSLGSVVDRPFPYGQDAGYEVAMKIMRWFWYTEKITVGVGVVANARDARMLMESVYRKTCEGTVSDRNWPSVLELIYTPKISKFFDLHRAELSDLNLIS
jgi:hypothetical protein